MEQFAEKLFASFDELRIAFCVGYEKSQTHPNADTLAPHSVFQHACREVPLRIDLLLKEERSSQV